MLKSLGPARRRLFIALVAALFLFPIASAHSVHNVHTSVIRRDGLLPFPGQPTGSSTGGGTSSGNDGKTSANSSGTSSTTPTTSAPSSTPSPSSSSSPSSSQPQSSASAPSQSSSGSSSASNASSASASAASSATQSQSSATDQTQVHTSVETDAAGQASTVVYTYTEPPSSTSSGTPSSTGSSAPSSGGVSTPTIVGLAVAGGVALIGLVTFIIWKMGRKRFSDDYNDDADIKWPELNAHGESPHALPTQRGGGAGFETSSEVNLVRPDSRAGSFAASSTELYPGNDPYAVPPLPQFNPNAGVPYRDDPGAGYYDPYGGPVPQTLEGEAIPMTQIPARARSPMPPGAAPTYDGRRSPGPQAAFGGAPNLGVPQQPVRIASPGPGYGGRTSPGPQAAYGVAGGYAP